MPKVHAATSVHKHTGLTVWMKKIFDCVNEKDYQVWRGFFFSSFLLKTALFHCRQQHTEVHVRTCSKKISLTDTDLSLSSTSHLSFLHSRFDTTSKQETKLTQTALVSCTKFQTGVDLLVSQTTPHIQAQHHTWQSQTKACSKSIGEWFSMARNHSEIQVWVLNSTQTAHPTNEQPWGEHAWLCQ